MRLDQFLPLQFLTKNAASENDAAVTAGSLFFSTSVFTFVGDNCVEATPVPIPNTTVKLYSADGTAGAARWESTSSPTIYEKPRCLYRRRGFSRFTLLANNTRQLLTA